MSNGIPRINPIAGAMKIQIPPKYSPMKKPIKSPTQQIIILPPYVLNDFFYTFKIKIKKKIINIYFIQ